MIVRAVQVAPLRVADEETRVGDAFLARFGLRIADEVFGAVHADRLAAGPTCLAMRRVLSPKPQPTSSTRAPWG